MPVLVLYNGSRDSITVCYHGIDESISMKIEAFESSVFEQGVEMRSC